MTDELAFCNPKVTCVVESDIETVWAILKQWSTFYWIEKVQGQACVIELYEGQDNQIGSIRSVRIGESLMFEKLVAMDDETHTLKWRTVAHEDSLTPFEEASYINALLTLSLREITHESHTFCEWEVAFYTEQEFAGPMFGGLEEWMIGAFESLQKHVLTDNPTVNMTRRKSQAKPLPAQSHFPEDHLSRFADLHIAPQMAPGMPAGMGPGMTQQYAMPAQDPMGYPLRGMPGPQIPLQQSSKPMGTTARQGPKVGASQPTIPSWQAAQAQPPQARKPANPLSPGSVKSVQDWAAQQTSAQQRLNKRPGMHPMGSTYAPSHGSRGSSMDGMELPTARANQPSRYRGMTQQQMTQQQMSQRPDLRYQQREQQALYEGVQQDPRRQWDAPPMGAPQSYYDPSQMYDPRIDPRYDPRADPRMDPAQDARARSSRGPAQLPHRGSR